MDRDATAPPGASSTRTHTAFSDRVLDAAVEVFAERGYDATTVDHIAAAAKIDADDFYGLFATEEACFLTACDRALATASERVAESIPTDADWPTRVRAALDAVIELIEAEPAAARLLLVEARSVCPVSLDRYWASIDSAAAFLRPPVLDPRLPDGLEVALLSGVVRILANHIEGRGAGSLADLREELVAFLLGPYFADSVPAAPNPPSRGAVTGATSSRRLDPERSERVDGARGAQSPEVCWPGAASHADLGASSSSNTTSSHA